jgi:hypothetical protein
LAPTGVTILSPTVQALSDQRDGRGTNDTSSLALFIASGTLVAEADGVNKRQMRSEGESKERKVVLGVRKGGLGEVESVRGSKRWERGMLNSEPMNSERWNERQSEIGDRIGTAREVWACYGDIGIMGRLRRRAQALYVRSINVTEL